MKRADYLAVKRDEESLSDEEIAALNAMTIDTGRHRLPRFDHLTTEQALRYHEQLGFTAVVVRRSPDGVVVEGVPESVPGYLRTTEKVA